MSDPQTRTRCLVCLAPFPYDESSPPDRCPACKDRAVPDGDAWLIAWRRSMRISKRGPFYEAVPDV